MVWVELIGYLLVECFGEFLISCTVDQRDQNRVRRPGLVPGPENQPDDWTCPDASELARILGAAPAPTTEPLLPLLSDRRHPLWDRELDG